MYKSRREAEAEPGRRGSRGANIGIQTRSRSEALQLGSGSSLGTEVTACQCLKWRVGLRVRCHSPIDELSQSEMFLGVGKMVG